jgi:cytochrome c oxidase subunit 2
MQSTDVLHSMFIPAFRQKMDIVPGRYTYAYLTPIMEGEFRLACTEYCGTGHSKMRTMCKVHASKEARKSSTEWIEPEHPAWENGERIYKINCSGCHKVDVAATGPQFKGLWGKQEELIDGTKVLVDENYISESIKYPDAKVVAGYGPVSKMNSFKGKLTDADINQVIAYLKYLNDPDSVSNEPEGIPEEAK